MNLQFIIIDPQNDFADKNGHLFVPGADKDSQRLAMMLKRHLAKIDDIHVTLDTHHWVDIAHPVFWVDSTGQHPAPFTTITETEVLAGRWKTKHPGFQQRALEYVKTLSSSGRYQLTIWPPHCLIGQPGHNVVAPIATALNEWENTFAMVDFVTKGSNMWTEHYSAVQADVPDPEDPSTQLNMRLIETLEQADLIAISGQALSHCVANTVRDIANNFGDESIHKMVLIEDTTSPVPGFETLAHQFLVEMTARGMKTAKSTEFLI
jgi:nicotinamidase-related amidase